MEGERWKSRLWGSICLLQSMESWLLRPVDYRLTIIFEAVCFDFSKNSVSKFCNLFFGSWTVFQNKWQLTKHWEKSTVLTESQIYPSVLSLARLLDSNSRACHRHNSFGLQQDFCLVFLDSVVNINTICDAGENLLQMFLSIPSSSNIHKTVTHPLLHSTFLLRYSKTPVVLLWKTHCWLTKCVSWKLCLPSLFSFFMAGFWT